MSLYFGYHRECVCVLGGGGGRGGGSLANRLTIAVCPNSKKTKYACPLLGVELRAALQQAI